MAYAAVDQDGTECLYNYEPYRTDNGWNEEDGWVELPRGAIEKLIGRTITWDDEPVEIDEEAPSSIIVVPELSDEDREMLRYYWDEKQDIETYCNFRNIQPSLRKYAPDLLIAWENYKHATVTLEALIRAL